MPDDDTRQAILAELDDWLRANWDPSLTVGAWWERLFEGRWTLPTLPVEAYGRGCSRSDAVAILEAINAFGAIAPPGGLGLLLAAPTLASHGSRNQIDRFVPDILMGRTAWCQLFSEPGAGSDLAGLTARAERDGDRWIVNGQKVWTSLGRFADLGMLIARTDPTAPKHQGITWFVVDMHQAGIELRELREMTGHSMFNEVFLDDAIVEDRNIVGGLNNGWAVTNTTLAHERSGVGAGAGGGPRVQPGTVAGKRDLPVSHYLDRSRSKQKRPRSVAAGLIDFARTRQKSSDPVTRQGLIDLHIHCELGRLNNERLRAARAAGGDVPGMPNIAKLLQSAIVAKQREAGLRVAGSVGTLHAYDTASANELALHVGHDVADLVHAALYSPAPPIYGGTDQIQRNILGERVLGLPKEPKA